ncbi:MAG: CAP domain-containing protein [Terriglobales bacterium]
MKTRRAALLVILLAACSVLWAAQDADNESTIDVRNQPTTQPAKLMAGAASVKSGKAPDEDASAEAALLGSINRSRAQAGAAPLRMDDSLRTAARAHALLMVAKHQLEHNFPGEPSLLQRIADVSSLALDRAGENIAVAACPDDAAEELYHSPPHRENLLNPGFNLAGVAAIWSHGHLYVVQDFAHEVPSYSARETEKLVGSAIDEMRRNAGLAELAEVNLPHLDDAACNLARQARPNAHLLAATYANRKIVTYTQSEPERLQDAASRLLTDPNIHQVAVGACYARNANYPTGMYWIAVLLN